MTRSGLNSSRWLDAIWEPNTQLYVLPNGLNMLDTAGDGDAKLIVADIGDTTLPQTKIRVFKGADEITQQIITEIPCSIVEFNTENDDRKSAALAIGASSSVFIFKNMRPHFKFCLPPLNADIREQDIWYKASLEEELNVLTLTDDLKLLSQDLCAVNLSSRTLKLLSLKEDVQESFAKKYWHLPIIKSNAISIIGTIRKDSWTNTACSYLVVGTEYGEILIMDHRAFFVVERHIIDWPPVALATTGLWTGDGQIVFAGREGKIGAVKRSSKFQHWETLPSPAMALTTLSYEGIVVATMTGYLWAFSNRGMKLWKVQLPGSPLDITSLPVPQIGLSLLAVSITRFGVQIYDQKHHVDTITMFDSVSAMKYGRLGQEERAIAMITCSGGLSVKILKRTADFSIQTNQQSNFNFIYTQQKFSIPKKTKLVIEQTIRERSEHAEIHTTFQQGFLRLRLKAANKVHGMLLFNQATTSMPITLQFSVLGFGPDYIIKIIITHTTSGYFNRNLYLVCRSDNIMVKSRLIKLPFLITGVPLPITFSITSNIPLTKKIYILLCFKGQVRPLINLTVFMPVIDEDIDA
ncbi:Bardet-Biedl syndrome 1 protein homolog isoform X1 [Phymastichus coffea]|uniref:Bardet-Biedl syndrome 1 protein homolog isoform X1 n=1 Tax=Phymastichus coffea TaxID=108790 RepID=UPI00273CCBB3|nr:Bardet-Biedl syndrome 1 protein homolog isoform X1 [Phymastichus coffea]